MNQKTFLLLLSVFCFSITTSLYGINLSSESERIGYVDIKKIFNKFSEIQKAKHKLEEEINFKKEEIEKRREEIRKLKTDLIVQEGTIEFDVRKGTTGFTVGGDTVTVRDIQDRKTQILKMEKELEEFIDEAKKKIVSLDEEHTEKMLRNIYETIKKVGKEEGISIILDKKHILYGTELLDLTDKVMEKLKRQK